MYTIILKKPNSSSLLKKKKMEKLIIEGLQDNLLTNGKSSRL